MESFKEPAAFLNMRNGILYRKADLPISVLGLALKLAFSRISITKKLN